MDDFQVVRQFVRVMTIATVEKSGKLLVSVLEPGCCSGLILVCLKEGGLAVSVV
ncbi:hypothetical protein [uncultured Gimesia sp.]|uniref:hypothetical protein n=1 Tax=uncultured Gimesia sp. TaxID=1678688 RepID=UPI0030D8FEC7|tara:strand:- start:337638 stop:337799 length:162 start_codon:yes stop_codon:yes gene_type:complete